MTPIALGLRAVKGGAVTVGVAVEDRMPRIVLSTFLATGAEGDRLSLEPYRVATEMADAGEADAAVREGRRRQARLASEGLEAIVRRLSAAGWEPLAAALLIHRGGWITDLLAYSRAWKEHAPVAEGLAVRDALRLALARLGIAPVEMDEKSLHGRASDALGLAPGEIAPRLRALGAAAGRPWRKEQKLAAVAAWVARAGLH